MYIVGTPQLGPSADMVNCPNRSNDVADDGATQYPYFFLTSQVVLDLAFLDILAFTAAVLFALFD